MGFIRVSELTIDFWHSILSVNKFRKYSILESVMIVNSGKGRSNSRIMKNSILKLQAQFLGRLDYAMLAQACLNVNKANPQTRVINFDPYHLNLENSCLKT
jgi:hypothetical protein